MKRILLIFQVISLLIYLPLVGCSPDNIKENNDDTVGYSDEYISARTDWNIELTYLECTDEAIVIKICDYDNQGFAINDLYYELEYLDNGTWIKLSHMNENAAMNNLGYVFPSEQDDYVDTNSFNLFAFMPDVTLKTGHYRLTKVLSGRDFSVEFNLTFD